jgi:predicted membrane-bound dolichyl-phosphate-mannose-protein mannosyltransferase
MMALDIATIIVALVALVLCGITMVAAIGSIMWLVERLGAGKYASSSNKNEEEGKEK